MPGRHVGPRPPRAERFIEHFAGTDATVSDYLLSEVLARQPPDLREFLLRTSIVDMVCGELADALTGGSDGQRMLARLEHGGALLAPLDEHGAWHRYHPLFAELLRAELRAQLGGELEGLHRRAAVWLAAHGDRAGALRHVAMGRVWDLGTQLVIDHWVDFMINGEMAALRPVLEGMPRDRVDACPELSLAFGAAMLAFGKQELAEPHLRGAEHAVERVPPERHAQFAAALAAVGLYEGRFGGDPAAALMAAREWLGHGPVLEGQGVAPNLRGLLLTQLGIVESGPATSTRQSSTSSARTPWRPRTGSSGPPSPRARTSGWPACCAAISPAPCAAPTRRWMSAGAAAGRDRNPRPSRTACSQPSASSAINSTRPNASSARRARRCETRANGRSWPSTPSIACSC